MCFSLSVNKNPGFHPYEETGIFLLFIEFYPIMCQNLRQLIPAGSVKIYAQNLYTGSG